MKKYPLLIDVFIGHFLPKINALLVMFQSQRFISLRFLCFRAEILFTQKMSRSSRSRGRTGNEKKLKENGGGAVTYFDASHKNGTIGIFKPVCYPLFGNIFCEENGKQRLFDTKILILKVGSVFSNINNIVILMTQTVLLT